MTRRSPGLPLNAAALRETAIAAACKEFGITPDRIEARECCHARWFAIVVLLSIPCKGYGFTWGTLGAVRAVEIIRGKTGNNVRDWSSRLAQKFPISRMRAVALGRKLVAKWPEETERAA